MAESRVCTFYEHEGRQGREWYVWADDTQADWSVRLADGYGHLVCALDVGAGWHIELFKGAGEDGPVGSFWGGDQIDSLAKSGFLNAPLVWFRFKRS